MSFPSSFSVPYSESRAQDRPCRPDARAAGVAVASGRSRQYLRFSGGRQTVPGDFRSPRCDPSNWRPGDRHAFRKIFDFVIFFLTGKIQHLQLREAQVYHRKARRLGSRMSIAPQSVRRELLPSRSAHTRSFVLASASPLRTGPHSVRLAPRHLFVPPEERPTESVDGLFSSFASSGKGLPRPVGGVRAAPAPPLVGRHS